MSFSRLEERKLKNSNEKGLVTIEATLSLTFFMFFIVTILSVLNIIIAQVKIGIAIDATAKEISHYSYLYSLTGIGDSLKNVNDSTMTSKQLIDGTLSDIHSVYGEIQNLGSTEPSEFGDINSILSAWDGISDDAESLANNIEAICKDPKDLLFGVAKMGVLKGMDVATSRLIAAPLARVMVKKHLVTEKDANPENYLKSLRIIPDARGSYLGGLDFKQSTIFANNSSEIRIVVSYDVEVLPLLPIDFTFHFCQTAVTTAWGAGNISFEVEKSKYKDETNSTLWTDASVTERATYIRHREIDTLEANGYMKTRGLTDVPMYNPTTNTFAMISSMNPLYSSENDRTKTLDDISETAIRQGIEQLCGDMLSTTNGISKISLKTKDGYGNNTTIEKNCENSKKEIILVVPVDEGLKDKIEAIVNKSNTRGCKVIVVSGYGKGAKTSQVLVEENKEENSQNE